MTDQRFHILDAMRGVAAIAVVLLHLAQHTKTPQPPFAYLAVDFFFMLSGFVLTQAYEPMIRSGAPIGRFLKSRIVRLCPIFAIGVILGTLAFANLIWNNDPEAPHAKGLVLAAVLNVFLLPDPISLSLFPTNPPGWSLFLEVAVNILFAAILCGLSTGKLAAICALTAATLSYYVVQRETASFGTQWSDISLGILRTIYGFAFGMLVARLFGQSLRKKTAWSLLLLPFLAMLLTMPSFELERIYPALAVFILLPIVLIMGVKFEVTSGFRRISGALGDLSFPLYAVHFPFLIVFSRMENNFGWPPISAGIGFVVVMCAVSWIIAVYLDAPFRRWLTCKPRSASERRVNHGAFPEGFSEPLT